MTPYVDCFMRMLEDFCSVLQWWRVKVVFVEVKLKQTLWGLYLLYVMKLFGVRNGFMYGGSTLLSLK